MQRYHWFAIAISLLSATPLLADDRLETIQREGVENKSSEVAHWGPDAKLYSSWKTHSNRLIPVYTFGTAGAGEGIDITSYTGANSIYRDANKLSQLYHAPSDDSVDTEAEHMDQTNVFDIQLASLMAGKKHIFLVVFDGMDWQTTQAASIHNLGKVAYREGRGRGTHFQEYMADGTSQYGWMVTSPTRDGIQVDVNTQVVKNPGGGLAGGYNVQLGGRYPWSMPTHIEYLISGPKDASIRHAYPDSAGTATAMNCGKKTYNGSINVTDTGEQALTIAHRAQASGYRVGAVTSVPISHATPAATYAHNVNRDDYQDITRDLIGRPSISHPDQPLPGLDVLIGCGYGMEEKKDKAQGTNFVEGNIYLTDQDLKAIDTKHGGNYVVAIRTPGVNGRDTLQAAAVESARDNKRLLGFYGVVSSLKLLGGHLPFASANCDFCPAPGVDGNPLAYTPDDLEGNPTLADMTRAVITSLARDETPFWLMVEAGDVDWANHANNLDASIGAVNSGDAAVRAITDWVEANSNWNESVMIVTADHAHYMFLDRPELLYSVDESKPESAKATPAKTAELQEAGVGE